MYDLWKLFLDLTLNINHWSTIFILLLELNTVFIKSLAFILLLYNFKFLEIMKNIILYIFFYIYSIQKMINKMLLSQTVYNENGLTKMIKLNYKLIPVNTWFI